MLECIFIWWNSLDCKVVGRFLQHMVLEYCIMLILGEKKKEFIALPEKQLIL